MGDDVCLAFSKTLPHSLDRQFLSYLSFCKIRRRCHRLLRDAGNILLSQRLSALCGVVRYVRLDSLVSLSSGATVLLR